MAASVQCPQCGQKYPVTTDIAGKPMTCRVCGASFSVPSIGLPSESAPLGTRIAPRRPEPRKPAPPAPRETSLPSAAVDPLSRGRVVSWSPVGTWRRRREILHSLKRIVVLLALIGVVVGIVYGAKFLGNVARTRTFWRNPDRDRRAASRAGQPRPGGPSAEGSARPATEGSAHEMAKTPGTAISPGASATSASADQEIQALVRQYGEDKVVTITVEDVPEGKAAFVRAKIREASGLTGIIRPSQPGTVEVVIAPVAYVQGVANRIGFGQVTAVDPAGRTISVTADPTRFPPPIKAEATNPTHPDYLKANFAELESTDPDRRCQAADRLRRANPKENREEIAKAFVTLMSDNDPMTRRAAVLAWSVCRTEASAGAAVEAMARLAGDPDESVRSAAWETWGTMPDQRAVAAAARLLRDESARLEASRCLTKMGPAAEQAVLESLASDDRGTRQAAAGILEQIATRKCTSVLVKYLQGADDEVAKSALRILAKLKDTSAIEPVAALLDNPTLGAEAVNVLVETGRAAEKAVIAVAKRGNKDSLGRAMEVLDKIGSAECVPVAIEAADSDDPHVFWTAFRILQRLKDERSIVPMAELLSSLNHRGHAAEVLKAIGPPAEDVVLRGLKHRNREVVARCVEILGVIGTKKSLPPLAPLAQHRDAAIREAARQARASIAARGGISQGGLNADTRPPGDEKIAEGDEDNPFRPARPAGEKKSGEKKGKKSGSKTIE